VTLTKINNNIINSAMDATGEYMRILFTFCIVLLLITSSIKSYADEGYTTHTEQKNTHSDLVNNSSPVSQLLLTQDLTTATLDNNQVLELTPKIKGEFTTRLLSIEAGMLQSKKESNWNKYYFQGAVTLHQYNQFNVSLMANIEQINNFNHHNDQIPFADSSIIINQTELNYSYGIITSYSVNPAWKFSGGIIHAESLNESPQNTWYGDANVALIGTTYSF
jgi:hypothetical protein